MKQTNSLNRITLVITLINLCLLSACTPINHTRHKDDWFGRDKAQHFAVSAFVGASTSTMLMHNGHGDCESATGGIAFSVVVGAGKEYHDKYNRNKNWSWKDMLWNFIGGTVGSLAATGCH